MAKEMIKYDSTIGLTKEIIRHNFYNADTDKVLPARTKEPFLKKWGFYEPLINLYNDSESIMETIYRFMNDINIRPVCKYCGGHINYNPSFQFMTYCSQKCKNNDPEMKKVNAEHVSESLKQKYNENGKEINDKRKSTLMEKYNVDSSFKASNKSNTLYDDLKKILSECGISDDDYECDVKQAFGNLKADIIFHKKRKVVFLNNSYIYTNINNSRNEYMNNVYNKDKYSYRCIVKDMIYNDTERFKKIILEYYNDIDNKLDDTLYI